MWLVGGDRQKFEHHPLTAAQVAALCDAIAGEGYSTPKSKRSRRSVPPPWLAERLHAYWSQPIDMTGFYRRIFRTALEAIGLAVSAPPRTVDRKMLPADRGVRVHDLRHSFATMHLMAGTHFTQISKWLGHSTFTLTRNTYGDWTPEEDAANVNHLLS